MKKVLVFALIAMVGAASASAYTDEAGDYTAWNNGEGATTAFGNWTLNNGGGTGGSFLGNAGDQGANSATINSANDTSFGLWSSAGSMEAYRSITQWADGYTFTAQLAYQFDGGAKGFTFAQGATELGYFTINATEFVWSGGSQATTAWGGLREFGDVINITLTQSGGNVLYNFASTIGTFDASGSVAGTLDTIRFFNAAGGGDDGNNLYFNNLEVAIPEPATMSLLGLGALAMVLRRKMKK